MDPKITLRANLQQTYSDVLTPEVLAALEKLIPFND